MRKKIYTIKEMREISLDEMPSIDLPQLAVEKIMMPKDGGKYMVIFANVKKSIADTCECPYCREKTKLTYGGRGKPRLVHDVVRNNFRVDIVLQPPRLVCNYCEQRFTPSIEGIEDGRPMTTRLLESIKKESFLQPHTVLAERCGLSIETIQNIMDGEIDKYDAMRAANPPQAPRVLGIDEKHICNAMRGTLVDVENGHLIEMLENNKKQTMENGIKSLDG